MHFSPSNRLENLTKNERADWNLFEMNSNCSELDIGCKFISVIELLI